MLCPFIVQKSWSILNEFFSEQAAGNLVNDVLMDFVVLTFSVVYNEYVIADTGILQDLARVMIRDCCYDVSYAFMSPNSGTQHEVILNLGQLNDSS